MQFAFNSRDIKTIATLRAVTHVSDESNRSSAGHILVMFRIDTAGARDVVKLVDGNHVGRDVAYVIGQSELGSLPVVTIAGAGVGVGVDVDGSREVPPGPNVKYLLELIPEVEVNRCYHQLFVGDMYNSTQSMTSWHVTHAAALAYARELLEKAPTTPHAYIIKYEFERECTYVSLKNAN